MEYLSKKDIANFIEANLKELGGDAYGVDYVAEKLWEWHESELKNFRLVSVSDRYLSAEKSKQKTLEALKEIAAKEYDTKCVLEQIEEATENGSFEIQTYDDKKVRDNLVLLGYKCSESFKSWNDVYMKVSWI